MKKSMLNVILADLFEIGEAFDQGRQTEGSSSSKSSSSKIIQLYSLIHMLFPPFALLPLISKGFYNSDGCDCHLKAQKPHYI